MRNRSRSPSTRRKISYGKILQIYFSVAHDPTQFNYQGPDIGPQYRSAIFPTSEEQARVAKAYIAQLDQAQGLWRRDRHDHRTRPRLLPGRGLSPGLPDAEPDLSLYRHQRPAEGREPGAHLPGALPRRAGPGHGGQGEQLTRSSIALAGCPRIGSLVGLLSEQGAVVPAFHLVRHAPLQLIDLRRLFLVLLVGRLLLFAARHGLGDDHDDRSDHQQHGSYDRADPGQRRGRRSGGVDAGIDRTGG